MVTVWLSGVCENPGSPALRWLTRGQALRAEHVAAHPPAELDRKLAIERAGHAEPPAVALAIPGEKGVLGLALRPMPGAQAVLGEQPQSGAQQRIVLGFAGIVVGRGNGLERRGGGRRNGKGGGALALRHGSAPEGMRGRPFWPRRR